MEEDLGRTHAGDGGAVTIGGESCQGITGGGQVVTARTCFMREVEGL